MCGSLFMRGLIAVKTLCNVYAIFESGLMFFVFHHWCVQRVGQYLSGNTA
jgi:hypothetical protein